MSFSLVHILFEYLAFFLGYRYYVHLRANYTDLISTSDRWSIFIGAAIGALIGSRVMAYLENPMPHSGVSLSTLMNLKTIMGGLFGGLIGVELAKKIIGQKNSSGDLFVLPLIAGILIGRIGCLFAGMEEFTYGKESEFFLAMDLGDGVKRHPLVLYELTFLAGLFVILRRIYYRNTLQNGELFKIFMLSYFGFRFFLEFLKPNTFFLLGLSSIQWLCIVCWVYYLPYISKSIYARS